MTCRVLRCKLGLTVFISIDVQLKFLMYLPSSEAEKQLINSLSSEQLYMLSMWLTNELIDRIDEGYEHPDLVCSLVRMAQKIQLMAKIKNDA